MLIRQPFSSGEEVRLFRHRNLPFLRVVEVFPPLFPIGGTKRDIDVESALDKLIDEVKGIRRHADLVLVASLKNPELLKVSTLTTSSRIQEETGIETAPSIVVRDSNRLQLLSEILTSFSLGLKSVMLAWGDRYPPGAGVRNSYDFRSLSEVIRESVRIAERTKVRPRILAPVTLASVAAPVKLGMERVRAGASLLLSQPPTTDSLETFDKHAAAIESGGLSGLVLPNVFPFRDEKDVIYCEEHFGWKLPRRLHDQARSGRKALILEAREVVQRLKGDGFPGVYVSTRGDPSIANEILG
jgi:5,10-methylenetetrahydrofolate reductase